MRDFFCPKNRQQSEFMPINSDSTRNQVYFWPNCGALSLTILLYFGRLLEAAHVARELFIVHETN